MWSYIGNQSTVDNNRVLHFGSRKIWHIVRAYCAVIL